MRDGFIKVAAASPSLKVGNPSFNKDRIIKLMNLLSPFFLKKHV